MKHKVIVLFIFISYALQSCDKPIKALTTVPELHLHTSFELNGLHLRDIDTSPFGMYLGVYDYESEFWKKRWDITIESDAGLYLAPLEGNCKIIRTYSVDKGENCMWSDQSYLLPTSNFGYSELFCFKVWIPDEEGTFPFRLRFKNTDTGEVTYSRVNVIKSTRCSDKSCWFDNHKMIEIERM